MSQMSSGSKHVTHTQPSLLRCWTQRCSRQRDCRPGRRQTAEQTQRASCCPGGRSSGGRWTEGTTRGQDQQLDSASTPTVAKQQRPSYPEASDLSLRINQPEKVNTLTVFRKIHIPFSKVISRLGTIAPLWGWTDQQVTKHTCPFASFVRTFS